MRLPSLWGLGKARMYAALLCMRRGCFHDSNPWSPGHNGAALPLCQGSSSKSVKWKDEENMKERKKVDKKRREEAWAFSFKYNSRYDAINLLVMPFNRVHWLPSFLIRTLEKGKQEILKQPAEIIPNLDFGLIGQQVLSRLSPFGRKQ